MIVRWTYTETNTSPEGPRTLQPLRIYEHCHIICIRTAIGDIVVRIYLVKRASVSCASKYHASYVIFTKC